MLNGKINKREVDFMSVYDAWLASEKEKIHKEYEGKRQEMLEQSLLDGFDSPDKKSAKGQLSVNYQRLDQEEQTALDELMKTIEQ